MDSKERFSNRVENYVKYRPSYPRAAVEYLFEAVGFRGESIIADIGSGTGIFTGLLLGKVKRVYSVEPNKKMREAAEKALNKYEGFVSIPASAEATTLPDDSVDFITVAQAFHWFDREACRREFNRILKPGGKVVLIWNQWLTDDDFGQAYDEHLKRYDEEVRRARRNVDAREFEKFFAGGRYEKAAFPNSQRFDFKGLLGRTLSSSYVPLEGEARHDTFVEELKGLFEKYEKNGEVEIKYKTEIFGGEV